VNIMASIDKRPNGKWRARWREYPAGPQKTKHFTRKIDAEQFLVDIQHRLLSGTYTPPSAGQVTVAAYAEDWLGRRTWALGTHERVERELRRHILPALGSRPLASLRRAHIEEWAKALPLAVSSARLVYVTLSSMLAAAVDDERIPRNPAKGARLAKPQTSRFVPLSADDVRAIAHGAAEHVRAAILLAAGTGLRQGELFGLSADRVDFMRREVRVDRQLWTPQKGRPLLKAPKSSNGFRTIALSSLVVDALSAHIATFGAGHEGLVFHAMGQPVPRTMAAKYMQAATRAASVEGTWHDLRHHHASVLLSAGVSPAMVAERLGHDVKTLLATYAHVIRADEDRVRNIVDDTLGGSAEDWLRTKVV
jgi:integrase